MVTFFVSTRLRLVENIKCLRWPCENRQCLCSHTSSVSYCFESLTPLAPVQIYQEILLAHMGPSHSCPSQTYTSDQSSYTILTEITHRRDNSASSISHYKSTRHSYNPFSESCSRMADPPIPPTRKDSSKVSPSIINTAFSISASRPSNAQ